MVSPVGEDFVVNGVCFHGFLPMDFAGLGVSPPPDHWFAVPSLMGSSEGYKSRTVWEAPASGYKDSPRLSISLNGDETSIYQQSWFMVERRHSSPELANLEFPGDSRYVAKWELSKADISQDIP